MKRIVFRPLRRINKTGNIVVAGYMQWRKVMTADYNKFTLVIDEAYKRLSPDQYVYNHKGEQLFWFTTHPWDVPVFEWTPQLNLQEIRKTHKQYGIIWGPDSLHINYNMGGTDCDGIPCFSHYDANRVSGYDDVSQFEPLTVGTVNKWFGWFLFQLENSYLEAKK